MIKLFFQLHVPLCAFHRVLLFRGTVSLAFLLAVELDSSRHYDRNERVSVSQGGDERDSIVPVTVYQSRSVKTLSVVKRKRNPNFDT
jgi:hypothetical protein